MLSKTAALILAAGQGTRMKSALPKVLHPVAGVPMVAHVVARALACGCDPVVVVVDREGRRVHEILEAWFPGAPIRFAIQRQQLGTGDAARAGMEALPRQQGRVLILYGDVPLITAGTLKRLLRAANRGSLALLTAEVEDPRGYGRILRSGTRVAGIIEERDASPEEKMIDEVNCGFYAAPAAWLRQALSGLRRDNHQREYYLTDIVTVAPGGAVPVVTEDLDEVHGINDRLGLAEAEILYRDRRVMDLMASGVAVQDPLGLVIGAEVEVGRNAVLGFGLQLVGRTEVGAGALVEGPTFIKDTRIARDAHIAPFCHLEGAVVGRGARIGPFARLRPAAWVAEEARVGNFVEMKKSRLGRGAKANHLAYLGDAEIGPGCNIGAGTITCNYDGVQKHPTTLGKGVFVGSNATLVAPLTLADGAYVGAGSTITHSVPKNALGLGRARQENKPGYAARLRRRQQASKAAATAAKPAAKMVTVAPRRAKVAKGKNASPRQAKATKGKSVGPRRAKAAKGKSARPRQARATKGKSASPRRAKATKGTTGRGL